MKQLIQVTINGEVHDLAVEPYWSLLDVLRNVVGDPTSPTPEPDNPGGDSRIDFRTGDQRRANDRENRG